MVFCKNCGKEIDEKAIICPHCGVAQNSTPGVVDNGGLGYTLLSCCIPIIGLILWLVWKDTKPVTSKACAKGTIIGFVITVIYYIAWFALGFGAMMMGGY